LIERYLSREEQDRLEALTTALNAQERTPSERLANGAELSFALTTLLAERGYPGNWRSD